MRFVYLLSFYHLGNLGIFILSYYLKVIYKIPTKCYFV